MCQLLGLNANTPTDVNFSFHGLTKRAVEHADGFGVAFFEGHGLRLYVDTESAVRSPVAQMIAATPLRSCNVVAHIRKATQGIVALENTHPFQRELWGRYWAFAHNGNLEDFHPKLHGMFRPVGTTDSERAFCWLMQELSKHHASMPTPEALTETLQELMATPARHGSFNVLLSQGDALWAHCSTRLHYVERAYPFATAKLQDDDVSVDFSSVTRPSDRACIVATEPLTVDEPWVALPIQRVTRFDGGRRALDA